VAAVDPGGGGGTVGAALGKMRKCSPVGSIRGGSQVAQPVANRTASAAAMAAHQRSRLVPRGDTSMPPAGGFLVGGIAMHYVASRGPFWCLVGC
jgi:hypothetical protein